MSLNTVSKRIVTVSLFLLFLSGCASVQNRYASDPLESINRGVDQFNQEFDVAVGKPVAKSYRFVTPSVLDLGVTNFFNNLADVPSAVNNLLQLKPTHALTDIARVCINTTLGLFGLFDVTSDMGIPNYKEDFGQTLGYWGMGDTPYLVVPFLGPKTLRDLIGMVGDTLNNPISYPSRDIYYSLMALKFIDIRADLLEAGDVLDEAAVDRYAFQREFYLQKRYSQIKDGPNHMDDDDLFDESLFEDEELLDKEE
ncbi:MAG: VacJ family lipoprotein [Candidatus Thiodiazotropha sp. (ex Lucinoma aequizonata)]|nr:VacJ family lipoprotein [Candidatus Thiodiazotropha sp. (ex Lucinoma aequizonata)]MCU7887602.1 VacJ family lipoprotein [Candidatus Thiodiazotropha sp. (ex Lucinoma aequizonata)]MCU7896958.1 VacJ family lipoprotein [Candidatus Thiodiazotropha sp. (ex Lucinoma aequizonata)]MCU7898773.1 VacJ family lipoprotein [Candidatus Thiodiazotropha sp. (ex Lucinoma aequizonata)]MCU7903523.1 VacJ family lipoprotein [Candidatus Thiodiazotropha sp. (ex Lucinoma aequizonata)]